MGKRWSMASNGHISKYDRERLPQMRKESKEGRQEYRELLAISCYWFRATPNSNKWETGCSNTINDDNLKVNELKICIFCKRNLHVASM